jgi:hypothetical protein
VTRRWTGRGLCLTGRVRSVFSVCACFSFLIGRAARPVTVDRTRLVIEGAYWTPTGRWHCGVRSVLQRVRSLFRCALLRLDQRVRSVTGPARPFELRASGRCVERVRSVVHERRLCVIGASDQLDQRVRSTRLQRFQVPNGYIRRGTSINTRWPAQGSHFWTFDILVSTLS